MPSHKKSWILVKGCEYNPNRSLSLGQIFADPFEPSFPLLPDGPLPIPPANIEPSYQDSVTDSSSSLLSISFRIWAEIDLLPVKGDVGGHRQVSKSLSWHFDRLEGQIFVPRLADVIEAMKSDEVVSQIRRSKFNFRRRLYMVTGVRIARRARMAGKDSVSAGAHAKLGADLAAVGGPPATVGVDGSITNTTSNARSFQNASDFVYAYRLCEVYYGKEVYLKPYSDGETYGLKDNGGEDEDSEMVDDDNMDDDDMGDVVEEDRIVVEGISGSDYAGDGELRKIPMPETDEEDYYIL
ncbi:uncharacterized protein PAC_01242 [Phialocephala subalpina]|uniref:Uncharacterized protein n=1 Tax=Phialocephala subalpina TaxID=576137 RepID=A0A1L7WF21_9HELO|nr:uncharacterized protein PAC_01242 [Phialocephala subalpina]